VSPGSDLLATPEQQAEIEEAERQRTEQGLRDMHALMDRPCRCCGQAEGSPISGLCQPCERAIFRLQTDALLGDRINGKSRRQHAEAYIQRQAQT
jgi:hypothetical protein